MVLSPEEERKLTDIVKRYTGADKATVSNRVWLTRFRAALHLIGIHWRAESFLWDDETGAFYALGRRCRFCEIPES